MQNRTTCSVTTSNPWSVRSSTLQSHQASSTQPMSTGFWHVSDRVSHFLQSLAVFVWKCISDAAHAWLLAYSNSASQWKMSQVNHGYGLHPCTGCIHYPVANGAHINQTAEFRAPWPHCIESLHYVTFRDLRSFEIRFEFESDDSYSIRFESDRLIQNFRIGPASAVVSQTTLTVQQKTSTIAPL